MAGVKDVKSPIRVQFSNRVKKGVGNECWVWVGARASNGYGVFKKKGAHRVSWELHCGKIPDGLFVLHKCDNPPCVRPDHLFIGDQTDNMSDASKKGRIVIDNMPGEKHPLSKLTEDAVRKIRAEYEVGGKTQYALADKYGVSQSVIRDVVLRRGWKHVT
jgi:hypothetical protein